MDKIFKLILLIYFSLILFDFTQENCLAQKNENSGELWYQRPMRIAALQYNFNEDNLAVIDKWVDMNFNVEQLFHPIAELYSAIYIPGEHKKILTKYVEKAHQDNIKIILYLNIHVLGQSFEHNKQLWSQRRKNGSISYLYNTFPSVCLNSPWKSFFYSVLDSLKNIDIDGIFLDGPSTAYGGCYCEYCQAKYETMFGSKPGTDSEKRWEFNASTKDEFLQDVYDYFKKDNPDKIVYMNLPIAHSRTQFVNIENALKYNDIVGTEGGFMFYGPSKNAFLWRPSFSAKLSEALAPDKPRVIFMAADHKPWSWWMHSPLETKLCISSVTANSANIWYGLHGSSKLLNTPSAEAAKEVLTFYKENEEFLANTKSVADVALFFSVKNMGNDTEDAIRGYYSLLTESQISFDIISDINLTSERLSRYKVLIIPNIHVFDDNLENIVRDFVKSGGLLICELGASLYGIEGEKEKDFGLSDVLGISTNGIYKEHNNYNYFSFESGASYDQNVRSPYIPLPLLSLEITANTSTKIEGRALEDLKGRYVQLTKPNDIMITSNNYGKGKSVYFAGNFGEMFYEYHVQEYKAIINNIILEKLVDVIKFEGASTHLEVILREQGKRKILHLVNYQAGPTRPFEKVTIITDLKIKIPLSWNVTKANSNKLDKELYSKTSNFFTELTLPELREYDILVLE